MRCMKIVPAIAILMISGQLYAAEPMSADAVKSLMSNNTMNGKNLKKDKNFTNYFREDGTATKLTSKGKKWQGKWQVKDDGQHCVEWDKKKKRGGCGAIVDLGNGTYHKLEGDKPRIEFTITEGNAKNL